MSEEPSLLSVRGLSKRFEDITVLDGCELQVCRGEIHALLGANGAGKSTLVKLIAGLLQPTAGTMLLQGQPYAPAGKQEAEAAGVEIVQQELNLVPTLSVAENLLLTRLPGRWGVIRRTELEARARTALARVGLDDVDPAAPVSSLGVGRQQLVEIAAALDRDCHVLILDEPTAALSAGESQLLFERLRGLREAGVGMIYISHRLEEITMLADRISVLRDGKSVGTWKRDELSASELVQQTTGEMEMSGNQSFHSHRMERTALAVCGISGSGVQDVSLEVFRGERMGVTGLVGSGRTELLRAVFGADVATSGYVTLGDDSRRHRFRHPREAVAAGMAMVTEDRKQNGLLLTQSIRMNITLNALRRFCSKGIVRRRPETQAVNAMCEQTGVHRASDEQSVETLSGGNQQKVVISKWLLRDGDVFLLDEPTRGIDVAARRRIWELIASLTADGKAALIVSSDLEELLEHCDRIAVMAGGRLVETFSRADWSRERMMQAAFARSPSRGSGDCS